MKKYLILLIFMISSISADDKISLLRNKEYPEKMISLIDNAEHSITASFYIISFQEHSSGYVKNILDALIRKYQEGKEVKIIINQDSIKNNQSGNWMNSFQAYRYLYNSGLDVYYDNPLVMNHTKSMVVDDKYILIGSHNLSWSAFNKNEEYSIFMENESIAGELKRHINNIPVFLPDLPDGEVNIPITFFQNKYLMSSIFSRKDNDAFNIFMLLFSLDYDKPIILDEYIIQNHFSKYKKYLPSPDGLTQVVFNRCLVPLFNLYPGIFEVNYSSADKAININRLFEKRDTLAFSTYEFICKLDNELNLNEKCVFFNALHKIHCFFAGNSFRWEKSTDKDHFPYSMSRPVLDRLVEKGIFLKKRKRYYAFSDIYRRKIMKSFADYQDKN